MENAKKFKINNIYPVLNQGVLSLDEYETCISCNSKVQSINSTIGECGKCGTKVKLACFHKNISAKFIADCDACDGKNWSFNDQVMRERLVLLQRKRCYQPIQ